MTSNVKKFRVIRLLMEKKLMNIQIKMTQILKIVRNVSFLKR